MTSWLVLAHLLHPHLPTTPPTAGLGPRQPCQGPQDNLAQQAAPLQGTVKAATQSSIAVTPSARYCNRCCSNKLRAVPAVAVAAAVGMAVGTHIRLHHASWASALQMACKACHGKSTGSSFHCFWGSMPLSATGQAHRSCCLLARAQHAHHLHQELHLVRHRLHTRAQLQPVLAG